MAKLAAVTEQFITEGLGGFALKAQESSDPIVGLYRSHRVRYAIGLVYPDCTTRWYRFDFSGRSNYLTVGTEMPAPVDMVHRIAASALLGWIERRKSFFYVRAYSRRFSTLHTLSRQGEQVRIEPLALPDLLMHYVPNVAAGSETAALRRVDLEIEELGRSPSGSLAH